MGLNPTGHEVAIGYINYFRLLLCFYFFPWNYWLAKSNAAGMMMSGLAVDVTDVSCFNIFLRLILDFFFQCC